MTISSTNRKAGPFLGNGSTVAFPFPFKVFKAEEVLAVRLNSSTGEQVPLALTTDYTVALNTDQNAAPGGTVTLLTALAAGFTLTLTSVLEPLQPVDVINLGAFYPSVINAALDRATILIQQLEEEMQRTVRVPVSDATALGDLPGVNQRAGRVLAFDTTSGAPMAGPRIADVQTVAETSTAISTVAAAINDVQTVADHLGEISRFAGVYLGPAAADPTTRLDGSALQNGDLYFNTGINRLRVYGSSLWTNAAGGSISSKTFSGTGSKTAFTLDTAPGSKDNTQVYIGGVYQTKSQYSVAGTTLTFNTAPPAGTGNVEVICISNIETASVVGAQYAQLVASETIAAGKLVNVWNDAGVARMRLADASVEGRQADGFVIAPVSAGTSGTMFSSGYNMALSGVSGGTLYLSATAPGDTSAAPPTASGHTVQRVGVGVSATSMLFVPGLPIVRA